jgi:hypothetical protein
LFAGAGDLPRGPLACISGETRSLEKMAEKDSEDTNETGETQGKDKPGKTRPNVGMAGRIVSAIAGAGAMGYGLYRATRHPWFTLLALVGPPLLARAFTGKCMLNRMLGIDTAKGEA